MPHRSEVFRRSVARHFATCRNDIARTCLAMRLFDGYSNGFGRAIPQNPRRIQVS
jgi:hypothetical protein